MRFSWAGPIDPRQPHYYRLHGPTLLIEYDNSQNRANHVHSVWHDPRNDFGADLLRAHYEHDHHHRPKTGGAFTWGRFPSGYSMDSSVW